jgi:hypothetical protein
VGDFNQDGLLDLAVTNLVSILRNDGAWPGGEPTGGLSRGSLWRP